MNVDLERLKTEVRIEDLIAQTLTLTGRGRILSTVEHDSLKIYIDTNSWTQFSKDGKKGKYLGGSTIDWVMHRDHCDEGAAIAKLSAMLDGQPLAPAARPRPVPPPKAPDAWQSPEWQAKARQALETAQDRLLNASEGQPGREYLQQRAIRLDMASAWGLGYGDAWNGKAARLMPAIWVPYMNKRITAIQYRFVGVAKDDAGADRFGQLKGGKRYLCGLHLCYDPTDTGKPVMGAPLTVNVSEPLPPGEPGLMQTLFLVEGELNAISIFQTIYGMYAADVLSFGPQSNISNPEVARMVATIAGRYKRVIVWADEPEVALSALNGLPSTVRRLAVKSVINDVKRDANDLLQTGELDNIVFALIRRVSE